MDDQSIIIQIDSLSYGSLIKIWRHGSSENPMLQGATGDHFSKVMKEQKDKLTHEDQVAISKLVGW